VVGHEESHRAGDQEMEGEDLILLSDVYLYAGRGLRFRRALDIGTVGFGMFLLTCGLVVELCYFHARHPLFVSIYAVCYNCYAVRPFRDRPQSLGAKNFLPDLLTLLPFCLGTKAPQLPHTAAYSVVYRAHVPSPN
jgi:hypothetical protein